MNGSLKAIIFDFDGVLADSEALHFRGFQAVLLEERINLSAQDYAQLFVGLTDAECFRAVFHHCERSLQASDLESLMRRKRAWMLKAFRSRDVLIPGITDFVNRMARRYRLAVASCALRREILIPLQRAGLLDAFEVIVAAEDVRAGKPDPAVYLHAVKKMQRKGSMIAAECLAIEDTPLGIRAAQSAGLKCLAVTTTLPAHTLTMADAIVPSLVACDVSEVVDQLYS